MLCMSLVLGIEQRTFAWGCSQVMFNMYAGQFIIKRLKIKTSDSSVKVNEVIAFMS